MPMVGHSGWSPHHPTDALWITPSSVRACGALLMDRTAAHGIALRAISASEVHEPDVVGQSAVIAAK
ncbi:MAG TPA: hypothetical protein PKZ38_01450, partial [Dermatophilaceae bacterium]|nr:hypothetical protein [Dermatophilaceae bacterium]